MRITLFMMTKWYRTDDDEKDFDVDEKTISKNNPPFSETNYFSILTRLAELGDKPSYVILTDKRWMKQFAHGEKELKITHDGVDIYYTDQLQKAKNIINADDISIIRGNYVEWSDMLNETTSHIIFLPCWSKIKHDNLKFKIPSNNFTAFVDDQRNMVDFKNHKIDAQLFKKPAPKFFYTTPPTTNKKDIDALFICKNTNRLHKRFDLLLALLRNLDIVLKSKIKITIIGETKTHNELIKIYNSALRNIYLDCVGRIGRYNIIDFLDRSKMMLCLSDWDANPRTISESMSRNVPVLCPNDLRGGLFQIKSGITGEIFKSTDMTTFSYYFLKLLDSYSEYKVRENCFTIDDACNQIKEVL